MIELNSCGERESRVHALTFLFFLNICALYIECTRNARKWRGLYHVAPAIELSLSVTVHAAPFVIYLPYSIAMNVKFISCGELYPADLSAYAIQVSALVLRLCQIISVLHNTPRNNQA
jgi:hypothetical protein